MTPVLLTLIGLALGYPLNLLIDRAAPPESRLLSDKLRMLVGGRSQLSLLIPLLSGGMALALVQRYDLSWRFAILYIASLVLIHTGAVDWRVRLIDTLVIVIATVLTLVTSSLNVGWRQAGYGALFAAIGFLVIYMVARFAFPAHAAPFGLGDVYLGIFLGALLGVNHLPAALFYGMLMAGLVSLGIIMARAAGRKTPVYISYGSFLCLGTILYMVLWQL